MNGSLPFFNFSLKKVIAAEPDSFKRAKIKILLTILLFSIFKALLVFPVAIHYAQYRQLFRAAVVAMLFTVLAKILLYRPASARFISHIILLCGLVFIWTNLFIYAQYLNIITIQLIFMTTLASYYLIGGRQAAFYTALAMLPVVWFLFAGNTAFAHINVSAQELAMAGSAPIIALNFITFIISHYLFYQAFNQTLQEKDALNRQLQSNIAEVEALADSRSVFLSTMSHELRTPLNGVIGMAHLLRDSAIEEQQDKLEVLEFSANNLLAVINDVLDYNKSELDKIELELLPVSLPVLLRQINSGLAMKAAEQGLNLVLDIDDTLTGKMVITDPTRITQVIYNLAGNAIKFTDEGEVRISALVMEARSDKMRVRFTVSDTGIGIAADRQQAIFDPFTQGSSDTTRKYGGTGLGLAIVKRLLLLFGSTIQLESRAGEGSVFTFDMDFPWYAQEQGKATRLETDTAGLKGLKLLIAEDNRINVLLLEKLLQKWQIESVVAGNGQEAVDKLLNDDFDCILMDIHMPVMDGYTASKTIRALPDAVKASLPIIAITASVSHNLQAKISEAGMQDYIHKPFQPSQLFEKLKGIQKRG